MTLEYITCWFSITCQITLKVVIIITGSWNMLREHTKGKAAISWYPGWGRHISFVEIIFWWGGVGNWGQRYLWDFDFFNQEYFGVQKSKGEYIFRRLTYTPPSRISSGDCLNTTEYKWACKKNLNLWLTGCIASNTVHLHYW